MRRSVLARALAFVGVLSAAQQAFGRVDVKRSGNTLTYDITVDDVHFKEINIGGMAFKEAQLMGVDGYTGIQYELGRPELPVIRFTAVGNVKIDVAHDFDVQSNLIGNSPIKPSQPSWDKNMPRPPVAYDQATYKLQSFLGTEEFSVDEAGSIRGVPQKLITLRPFKYNPASGEYSLTRSFRVTVRQPANMKADASEMYAPTIAFVIGAKFAGSSKLNEFQQLKESQGYRVQRLIVGQNGLTNDVAIRSALQALLKNTNVNLRYAVLIGDVEDVPSHEAKNIKGVTDHFYRAIDTDDYEADINGPDIGVGRISVQSEEQLAVVVDKIKRYSIGKFGHDNWLNHPSFVTTHDRYQVAEGTHNTVIEKYFAPRKYDRVFPDANEKGGDKLYPVTLKATAEQIVSHIKSGRSIINYSGHGSNSGWEDVTQQDVVSFSDPDALPYVIGNACITADFRVSTVFGEAWLRHPNGAIVYWGSMDSSYWDEDDFLEKGLYEGLFDKGIRSFDLMHQNALAGVWKQYGGEGKSKYYWETYVTFGDPSLEFRPSRAVDIAFEGSDSVVMGASETQLRVVAKNGSGVANVHVVLRRPSDGVVVQAVTSSDGTATLNTQPFVGSADQLILTAYGSSVATASKTVPVVSPDKPFFGLNQWRWNDRTAPGAYVGETISIAAAVENFGAVATKGGRLFVANISGPATVMSQEAALPALASRGRGQIGQGLKIAIAKTASHSDVVSIVLGWESKEGSKGQTTIAVPVLRGDLDVTSVDYGSADREGISGTGDVYLTVKNSGNETIRGASVHGIPGLCSSSVTGSLTIAKLDPSESIRIAKPLVVTTDASCQSGSIGQLVVKGSYEGGATAVDLTASSPFQVGELFTFHQGQNNMGLAIPDKGDALEKTFTINEPGKIKDISVAVKIDHPYIGDIQVILTTPSGTEIKLRNNEGGSADNLDVRWGRGGEARVELTQLADTPAQGTWKISVKDTATGDTGTWQNVDFQLRHW